MGASRGEPPPQRTRVEDQERDVSGSTDPDRSPSTTPGRTPRPCQTVLFALTQGADPWSQDDGRPFLGERWRFSEEPQYLDLLSARELNVLVEKKKGLPT